MKDTIYREDAIKVVSHVAMECIDRKTRIELINAIPSADLNAEFAEWAKLWFKKELEADRPQEWIPCSERLPEKEKETYLICTEGGYMCSCRWTNDMYGLGSNEWSEWGWHIMDKPQYAKVVAWMEMEPWKGADDE